MRTAPVILGNTGQMLLNNGPGIMNKSPFNPAPAPAGLTGKYLDPVSFMD